MRRSLPATIIVIVGLLLLVDFVLINPALVAGADALLQLLVLLAAAAALAGAGFLAWRHAGIVIRPGSHRLESAVLLAGLLAMIVAGFYPGSSGTSDPALRWLVAALLAPLVASIFAMLFVFLLVAMRRGLLLRSRQVRVMLLAAGGVLVLLLPLGGGVGDVLSSAAGWSLAVPIGGVFRGLLIGVGIATAIQATRILLSVNPPDD